LKENNEVQKAVTDSQQGVVLQLGDWVRGLQLPRCKIPACYEMLHKVSALNRFSG